MVTIGKMYLPIDSSSLTLDLTRHAGNLLVEPSRQAMRLWCHECDYEAPRSILEQLLDHLHVAGWIDYLEYTSSKPVPKQLAQMYREFKKATDEAIWPEGEPHATE